MYLFSFKGTRKHLKYDFRLTLRYILQKILLRQRVSNFTFSLWIGASPLCIANAGVSEEVRTKMTGIALAQATRFAPIWSLKRWEKAWG